MRKLEELKRHLKAGEVYRRSDLTQWSRSVDRHLIELLKENTLQKLSQGLYYFPKETAFGKVPPEEEVLIRSFLKEDRFLLISLNVYNSLGVGTTQLYNQKIVYNHKRSGEFKFGNKIFLFRVKSHFPKKVTPEFLLVDLLNNLDILAEDRSEVLKNVCNRVRLMEVKKMKKSLIDFGNVKTKQLLAPLLCS